MMRVVTVSRQEILTCEMRLIEWDEPDRMNQGVDSNDEVAWCLIYIKEDVGGRQIEQGLQPRAL